MNGRQEGGGRKEGRRGRKGGRKEGRKKGREGRPCGGTTKSMSRR
jgi:hypothetical protein